VKICPIVPPSIPRIKIAPSNAALVRRENLTERGRIK
jgi:hypothetical protein